MTSIAQDARFGLRLLWRNPGFTAVAVLALALGIAANTAIFSVVYATLLEPMPYHDPDQLVMVWSRIQGGRNVTAAGTYLEWKRRNTVFQDVNAFSGAAVSLGDSERPEQIQAERDTPGHLTMFGLQFMLGRDFLPEEGQVGRDDVVVLSHKLWRDRFGSDRGIVGRAIRIDGRPHTVVGVLAPGPGDRVQALMRLPLAFKPDQINHDFHWLLVMARLKPKVTLAQANADMTALARRIAEENPSSNKGWSASVEPLHNNFLSPDTINGMWLLLGAVGFVLLIACANVANLLLARGTARQREVAVRASLGAGRARLFGQFLTESVLLAAMGGTLGVVLASILLRVILAAMPPFTLPSEADVRLNVPVLLFTLAASVLSGLVAGCAPAWQATRLNLNETLKEEGRSAVGGGRHRLRRALVVAEVGLALTLLSGGGLAIHSLLKLTQVDLGFKRDHLLTFNLPVPGDRLATPEQITSFYRQLLEGIGAVPGVTSVSASTGIPVQGTGFGMQFQIGGRPINDRGQRPGAGFNMVTPDFYRTLGIRMSRGRPFTDQDTAGSPRVAVVNEAFVKQYLKDVDPLRQTLLIEELVPGVTRLGPDVEWQIVGVYKDVKNGGPRGDFPEIDVPFWQSPWPGTVMAARTLGEPTSVAKGIAAVVSSMDRDLPLANVKAMSQLVDESLAGDRFSALLFGTFAGLALVLAALGIYGVMSFAVAQRTHEIGLRMALGAERGQVVRQILKEGLGAALVGVAFGTAGAWLVGRAMQGALFGVQAFDPLAFGVVASTLLASAVAACFVPARRAAAVDPMVALRQD
jgi:putative ABC transport system permease protein